MDHEHLHLSQVRDKQRRRKTWLNAAVVFRHYWQRPNLLQEKRFISWLPKLYQVSWRGFRSLPALSLCGILSRLLQLGSFQLFPFSILAYSLNKENKMKAFKDNAVFHKQMQNKAQEILSKVKNECCLLEAYLERVSLLVDRSETRQLRLQRSLMVWGEEQTGWVRVEIQLPSALRAGNSFGRTGGNTCESNLCSACHCHPRHLSTRLVHLQPWADTPLQSIPVI